MNGLLYKAISGFYYIWAEEKEYICRGAGKLRLQDSPKVGDIVEFSMEQDKEVGVITGVHPRKNELVRPSIANMDLLIIVISAKPKPDFLLCDKLIIMAKTASITPIIFANKSDMKKAEELLAPYAEAGLTMLSGSAATGEGMSDLLACMKGKICCFAGQSGVGKTSLAKQILPERNLEVGGISKKTSRGRHTTRHTELLRLPGGGYIADTPGFSVMGVSDMEPVEIGQMYHEFAAAPPCRFDDCLHIKEDGCMVKPMVEEGKIHRTRYDNYAIIIGEIQEQRRKQYD
ncbi:ribosome small subunit-dependent GTPase A [Clostridia bacterium OttesenSCG-928-F22]|nr:ribosome small subunit-dependent GTPase A [Clostridia bacterium OttesenSCG-928-F22]